MNDAPQTTLEKLTKKQRGIRVDFYWLGDRFGHTISALRDGEATVVWRSVDDDEFGPVYQELHEQTTDDGRTIVFLSGASAGAHWSASVEFEPTKTFLHFDVAARVTKEPIQRVIKYRGEFEDGPEIGCGTAHGAGETEWEESPPELLLLPAVQNEKLPTTLRCKYMCIASDQVPWPPRPWDEAPS